MQEIIKEFTVQPSDFDESSVNAYLPPRELVKELAKGKALAVYEQVDKDAVVIGSDTVVALGSTVLGKPKTEDEARAMLTALSGKAHAVYTGVCVVTRGKIRTRASKTEVYFNELTPAFIDEYIRSGSPMDKAGAYGIQDGGLVKKIRGSYTGVVGLPVELMRKMLQGVTE